MHTTSSDLEMAIPRVFNSNEPFTVMPAESELSFLSREDNSRGCEEEKESLVQAIASRLSRVMQHGTAKHVVAADHRASEEDPCVCIVAQAESKTGVGACRWMGVFILVLLAYTQ